MKPLGSRSLLVLLISAIAAGALSCGGNSSTLPVGQPTGPAVEQIATPTGGTGAPASQILAVKMRPQAPQELPVKGLSWLDPIALLQSLPMPKHISWEESDLLRSASNYEPELPSNKVTNALPPNAVFAPTWDSAGNPTAADLAYAMYRFALEGYDQEPSQTIRFSWVTPPADDSRFWVGLGDVDRNSWDWYAGPADDVLTLESFAPYIAGDGSTLLALVLIGTDSCILSQITIGDMELRATGGIIEDLPQDPAPPLAGGGSLPDAVDLSMDCSPVNDQGQIGSCTAFGIGDSAYNYELGQIYGADGWDFSDPFNLVSPKYLYLKTGTAQGLG